MSGLAGAPSDEGSATVRAVLKIETALAAAALTRVELRDPKMSDNPMTLAKLKAMAPRFDWESQFRATGVPAEGHVNVAQPKLVQAFDALLGSASLEEWRAYLRWRLLHSTAPYLAAKFETESFGFFGTTLTGAKQQRPRWQRCVIATDGMLGEAQGHEYVDRFLPPEAKARARQMAVNIVNELKLSIESRLDDSADQGQGSR